MKITKEVLINGLKHLQQYDDPEKAHGDADDLLLAFIGDEDITKEFSKIEKWYA